MSKKSTKKANPKNTAKEMLFHALKDWTEEMYTVFENEDFAANLTASTFIVDVNGVDVKVVLSTPNGAVENTRYEREEGVVIPETLEFTEEPNEPNEAMPEDAE